MTSETRSSMPLKCKRHVRDFLSKLFHDSNPDSHVWDLEDVELQKDYCQCQSQIWMV